VDDRRDRRLLELADEPAHPALIDGAPARIGRVPDVERMEVRAVGPRIADALDQSEPARAVGRVQLAQLGVQSDALVDAQDVARLQARRAARAPVAVVAMGHERGETVVAAGELHEDERAPGARTAKEARAAPARARERRHPQRSEELSSIESHV